MRIVIAEDDPLLREGLALLLRAESLDVVATTDSPGSFLAAVDAHAPDVAIVDVRMPPTHTDEGVRAAERLRAERPELGILLLSQVIEPRRALRLFQETPAGFGYLLKDRVLEIDDFLESVRRVARGGSAIDPEVIAQLFGRKRQDEGPLAELSPREREVLALMAEGLSNQGICSRLFLSPKTVETHVHAIFTKLRLVREPDEHRRVLAVLAFLRS
jgi:DNA-binding NarL/FixJ family response regulator